MKSGGDTMLLWRMGWPVISKLELMWKELWRSDSVSFLLPADVLLSGRQFIVLISAVLCLIAYCFVPRFINFCCVTFRRGEVCSFALVFIWIANVVAENFGMEISPGKSETVICRTRPRKMFWPHKQWGNFGRAESRTNWREAKNIQIKLAATCNKYGQQQDDKNSAEL